jgi:hypothetical protein
MTPRTPQNTKKEASREAAKYSPAYTVCRNELEPCTTAEGRMNAIWYRHINPSPFSNAPKSSGDGFVAAERLFSFFLLLGTTASGHATLPSGCS